MVLNTFKVQIRGGGVLRTHLFSGILQGRIWTDEHITTALDRFLSSQSRYSNCNLLIRENDMPVSVVLFLYYENGTVVVQCESLCSAPLKIMSA